ncbi:DUF1192 domain-containing protein [Alphaproteobacteria bacterium]|nr:DUF1192 domain-containing protein [Alphaproteobacteria bacterium]MDB2540650.1 DUF1192 domain-containing protein [Alphaproteobacteria bacterium]
MEEKITAPKDSALADLQKQDLSLQGVDELSARIVLLEAEIARARAMLESKKGSRDDAEALFK